MAWGSADAREAYRRFAAEWVAGSFDTPAVPVGEQVSVAEHVVGWMTRADLVYRKGGELTSVYLCPRGAMRLLLDLYGETPTAKFDAAKLQAVRGDMVRCG